MERKRIHYLQHVPFEGLGSIEQWAAGGGHVVSCTRLYSGEPCPDPHDLDVLFVMGGPMGVHDEDRFPWLMREKRFIEDTIRADKPAIGICLGAQLIASVLGARVYRNRFREIGWFPVSMTGEARQIPLFNDFDEQITVFHWHGDTFDIPAGAVHCARSTACENQMFLYGAKTLGIQFHFEATVEGITALIKNCRDELTPGEYIQDEPAILERLSLTYEINRDMERILERMADS